MLALEFIELNVHNDTSIDRNVIQIADIVRIAPISNEECFVLLRASGTLRIAHSKEWLIEQLEFNHHVTSLKNN